MISGLKPTDMTLLSEACKNLAIDTGNTLGTSLAKLLCEPERIKTGDKTRFPLSQTRMVAWIEALESGVYTQGNSKLCVNDRFCCLGVECEISMPDKKTLISKIRNLYSFAGYTASHPELRLGQLSIFEQRYHEALKLSGLNDFYGLSFYDIAQVLKHFVLSADCPE